MQKRFSFPLALLSSLLLVGCLSEFLAYEPPANPAQPPKQAQKKERVEEPEPPKTAEILSKFTSPVATASGSVRFLNSGLLEIGDPDAPNTLTVFTEYHCSYCKEFHTDYLPRLQEEFVDDGTLKIRIGIFTLNKYANSRDAAKGLLCAGQIGSAWEMHQLLFERESKHRTSIVTYARELGHTTDLFPACIVSEETHFIYDTLQQIAKEELGVDRIPAFFMGDEEVIGLPVYAELRGWVRSNLQTDSN